MMAGNEAARGVWAAIAAFVVWGLAPLYWHLLKAVPSLQIVLHRVVWSVVVVVLYLLWRDGRGWAKRTLSANPKLWWMLALSGIIISANWGLYIWAVNAGYVVETSLGYFISPLFNVLIGVLFMHERLRPMQWLSVAMAGAGVLWLTTQYGQFPWIAIGLAVSFGVYGVLRKLAHVDSVAGLGIESAYLFIPVLAVLLWIEMQGGGGFARGYGALSTTLLVMSGLLSALPLVWFAYAVRRIPLTSMGVLQYISPTLQFLIGVFVLHEAFDQVRLVGFACIWVALVVFIMDGLRHARRTVRAELV